jgi:Thioredoxin-like
MKFMLPVAMLLQTVVYSGTDTPPAASDAAMKNPEAKLYDAKRNAGADVDQALAAAKKDNKRLVVVMGANWCHDSTALAGWFGTPRFAEMIGAKYALVYVDVGTPQTGDGRNLDIAKRFGIKKVKSTPLVMVLSADGKLLNSKKDAASWRNAASRSEESIFTYFAAFTPA